MAKDKDKFKKSKKGTEENEVKTGNANMEEEKIENSTLPAREKDLRSIKINIDSYTNVAPFYKVSDIMIRVEYQDQILYESQKKCMTGDEGSELSEETFDLVFDANNPTDLEGLISNPLLFSLIQFPGEIDSDLLVQLMKAEEIYKTDIGRESLISIYEAMSGEKLPEEVEAFKEDTQKTAAAKKGSKKKAKKSSSEHLSKSSKSSKKSTKSSKSKEKNDDNKNGKPDQLLKEQLKENTGSIMSGFCLLDLLPLFSGNLDFAETLLVKQLHPFQDERMLTLKNLPVLVVRASISKPLDVTSTILHVTLESFHNIPSLFDNMEFKVAVKVPYRDKVPVFLMFGAFQNACHQYQLSEKDVINAVSAVNLLNQVTLLIY